MSYVDLQGSNLFINSFLIMRIVIIIETQPQKIKKEKIIDSCTIQK